MDSEEDIIDLLLSKHFRLLPYSLYEVAFRHSCLKIHSRFPMSPLHVALQNEHFKCDIAILELIRAWLTDLKKSVICYSNNHLGKKLKLLTNF